MPVGWLWPIIGWMETGPSNQDPENSQAETEKIIQRRKNLEKELARGWGRSGHVFDDVIAEAIERYGKALPPGVRLSKDGVIIIFDETLLLYALLCKEDGGELATSPAED